MYMYIHVGQIYNKNIICVRIINFETSIHIYLYMYMDDHVHNQWHLKKILREKSAASGGT